MLLAPLSGPRGPGADTHHFPSPVCLPHQPSGLDMTQSQTPKTGASLAGRPGFSQVAGGSACILIVETEAESQQREGGLAECLRPAV